MEAGLTPSGLNYLGYALISGATLALCTDENTPIPANYRNYADVPCLWGSPTAGASDPEHAWFCASGGVLTNSNLFEWPEADDATGASSDGWGTVTHLMIRKGGTVLATGPLTAPANIQQDVMPVFPAGALRITFTATTVPITL